MPRMFRYARVSSKEQARSATSLPSQVNELCQKTEHMEGQYELAKWTNCEKPGVFVDPGVSAWKTPLFDRPGFQELWSKAHKGDIVVAMSMDRMFRSTLDFLKSYKVFEEKGILLKLVHGEIDMTTAVGRLMASTLASFAQFKVDLMSERVREGHAARKAAKAKGATDKKGKPTLPKRVLQAQVSAPSNHAAGLQVVKAAAQQDEHLKGRVWSYARVSTDQQTTDSQEPTIRRIEEECVNLGYRLEEDIYHEVDVSAFKVSWRDREIGGKIFRQAQKGDIIICSRLDRMFRTFFDMCSTMKELNDRGVKFRLGYDLNTDSMAGRMACALLGILAEWESQELSQRMKEVYCHIRAARGPWNTKRQLPAWGYAMQYGPKSTDWIMMLDVRVVRDLQIILDLQEKGISQHKIVEQMEQILARREDRIPIPPTNERSIVTLTKLYERKHQCPAPAGWKNYCNHRGWNRSTKVKPAYTRDVIQTLLKHWKDGIIQEFMERAGLTLQDVIEQANMRDQMAREEREKKRAPKWIRLWRRIEKRSMTPYVGF